MNLGYCYLLFNHYKGSHKLNKSRGENPLSRIFDDIILVATVPWFRCLTSVRPMPATTISLSLLILFQLYGVDEMHQDGTMELDAKMKRALRSLRSVAEYCYTWAMADTRNIN